jgi:hypothetical protein
MLPQPNSLNVINGLFCKQPDDWAQTGHRLRLTHLVLLRLLLNAIWIVLFKTDSHHQTKAMRSKTTKHPFSFFSQHQTTCVYSKQ